MCLVLFCIFFFKQKTAYEMRISDWSSDVCSSDLKLCCVQMPARRQPGDRTLGDVDRHMAHHLRPCLVGVDPVVGMQAGFEAACGPAILRLRATLDIGLFCRKEETDLVNGRIESGGAARRERVIQTVRSPVLAV